MYSLHVGSPLAFYTFHIATQSGTGFKRFSVNGLPNETSPGIVAFPKSKIGASMRDPNFRSATSPRHLALGKTRFFDPQFSIFDAISKV